MYRYLFLFGHDKGQNMLIHTQDVTNSFRGLNHSSTRTQATCKTAYNSMLLLHVESIPDTTQVNNSTMSANSISAMKFPVLIRKMSAQHSFFFFTSINKCFKCIFFVTVNNLIYFTCIL